MWFFQPFAVSHLSKRSLKGYQGSKSHETMQKSARSLEGSVQWLGFSLNRAKKISKHRMVSLAINYSKHVWAIDFNGIFLDFSALCKCRLLALHKSCNLQ